MRFRLEIVELLVLMVLAAPALAQRGERRRQVPCLVTPLIDDRNILHA